MSDGMSDDALNASMAHHPAGKQARRPGVRLVELRPAITEPELVDLDWTEREVAPAVRVLECISCGALLAVGSPLAAAHVEGHRGAWGRRVVRDARIRWHRLRHDARGIDVPRYTSSLLRETTARLRDLGERLR